MNKILDQNNMISNPVYYARSIKEREVGFRGYFKSRGWTVIGTVQSIVQLGLRQGFGVYMLQDVEELSFNGVEMTEEEILKNK